MVLTYVHFTWVWACFTAPDLASCQDLVVLVWRTFSLQTLQTVHWEMIYILLNDMLHHSGLGSIFDRIRPNKTVSATLFGLFVTTNVRDWD